MSSTTVTALRRSTRQQKRKQAPSNSVRPVRVNKSSNGVGRHRVALSNVTANHRKRTKLEKVPQDPQIMIKKTRLFMKEFITSHNGFDCHTFVHELSRRFELSLRAAMALYNSAQQKEVIPGEVAVAGGSTATSSATETETVSATRSSNRTHSQREEVAVAAATTVETVPPVNQRLYSAETLKLARVYISRLESVYGRGHPQIFHEIRTRFHLHDTDTAAGLYAAIRALCDDSGMMSESQSVATTIPSVHAAPAAVPVATQVVTNEIEAYFEAKVEAKADMEAKNEAALVGSLAPSAWVVWDRTQYHQVDLSKDQYDMEFRAVLFTRERQQRPKDYCGRLNVFQPDIRYSMRAILVDWLVEVAEEYGLKTQTLYLATHYIDYFLSSRPVSRSQLQLVGITCMLCASKYEEIDPPSIDDFVHISDMTYNPQQVRAMETLFLNTVKFSLGHVTPVNFAELFFVIGRFKRREQHMTWFLIESVMITAEYLRFVPSQIAAAAAYLSLRTFRPEATDVWTPALIEGTRYTVEDIRQCAKAINTVVYAAINDPTPTAVIKKYRSRRQFQGVSSLYRNMSLS